MAAWQAISRCQARAIILSSPCSHKPALALGHLCRRQRLGASVQNRQCCVGQGEVAHTVCTLRQQVHCGAGSAHGSHGNGPHHIRHAAKGSPGDTWRRHGALEGRSQRPAQERSACKAQEQRHQWLPDAARAQGEAGSSCLRSTAKAHCRQNCQDPPRSLQDLGHTICES